MVHVRHLHRPLLQFRSVLRPRSPIYTPQLSLVLRPLQNLVIRPLTLDPRFQTCQGRTILRDSSERSSVAAWLCYLWMVPFVDQAVCPIHLVGYWLEWQAKIGGRRCG